MKSLGAFSHMLCFRNIKEACHLVDIHAPIITDLLSFSCECIFVMHYWLSYTPWSLIKRRYQHPALRSLRPEMLTCAA